MATDARTINLLQTTDAEFRTWVADVIAGLLAVGLLQSADTGQINTATVTKPAGSSTSQGYAMFTPDDGLTDYYLKLEFGSGPAGAAQPALWITLGWATDGAGTLTGGQLSSRLIMPLGTAGNAGVASAVCGFCKSGSAISVFTNRTSLSSASTVALAFDRFRDASSGAALATGVSYAHGSSFDTAGGGVRAGSTAVPSTGGVPVFASGNRLTSPYPGNNASWGRGSNVGLFPVTPYDAGALAPMLSLLVYSTFDLSTGTVVSPIVYGASHSFIAAAAQADNGGGSSPARVAVIWE